MPVLDVNYDEAKVSPYELPDPLMLEDGTRVTDAEAWRSRRRPELLELFRRHMYGRAPGTPASVSFDVYSSEPALDGLAVRKQVRIELGQSGRSLTIDLLLYVPSAATERVPAFVGLNYFGNHSVSLDPGVTLSQAWMAEKAEFGIADHRATTESRGSRRHRWPIETILRRGYALATAYYGDLDPDYDDGFTNGVHGLFGPSSRTGDSGGSIAAWAWGLQRCLDYLVTDPAIDADRVAVMGHSRLAKTSLWAAAQDERFAMAISNCSGCGGASLSRRRFGETLRHINTSFRHWFCSNFREYSDREHALPIDQHELIALLAPRPVFVSSADQDLWADPRGEFLAARGASPVYELLGTDGLQAGEFPSVGAPPVMSRIGYELRSGEHDIDPMAWRTFLDFADIHLKRRDG
jgi:hypothetical protein